VPRAFRPWPAHVISIGMSVLSGTTPHPVTRAYADDQVQSSGAAAKWPEPGLLRYSRLQGEWLQDCIDSDRSRLQLARNETSSLGQFERGNAYNV